MEDLISKSKTLEWINENWEMEQTAGTKESSVRAELWHDFYHKVTSGSFSPDPIPLPTIKLGDKEQSKLPGIYLEVSHD